MNNVFAGNVYFGVILSIGVYLLGCAINKKVKQINAFLFSIVAIIAVLCVFRIDYDVYNDGAKYISYFLAPATVCLAIPLYRRIYVLKTHLKEILIGIFAGVIASMGSIFVMAYMFSLSHSEYVSLLPKSITMAIGLGLCNEYGGVETITIVAITITGILGNLAAEGVLKLFRITNPVARGLAIGTASHAIGTTKAMELGETEGAMSSLAIAVAGLMTVAAASVFVNLL